MSIIARTGFVGAVGSLLIVPAGQSLVVGNIGPGTAKVFSAAFINNQLQPIFAINTAVLPGTAAYITFAAATYVFIEAPASNDVEYSIGVAPVLTVYPLMLTNALTAKAGGGQAGATLLGNLFRIAVCATGGDSCLLPSAVPGATLEGYNAGAASANVFPQVGDAINSGGANAAFAVATTKGARFTCTVAGTWNAVLSA